MPTGKCLRAQARAAKPAAPLGTNRVLRPSSDRQAAERRLRALRAAHGHALGRSDRSRVGTRCGWQRRAPRQRDEQNAPRASGGPERMLERDRDAQTNAHRPRQAREAQNAKPEPRVWHDVTRESAAAKAKRDGFGWQVLRRTCGTFLTNAPGIFGEASAYRSARQLGHSVAAPRSTTSASCACRPRGDAGGGDGDRVASLRAGQRILMS